MYRWPSLLRREKYTHQLADYVVSCRYACLIIYPGSGWRADVGVESGYQAGAGWRCAKFYLHTRFTTRALVLTERVSIGQKQQRRWQDRMGVPSGSRVVCKVLCRVVCKVLFAHWFCN